MHVLPMPMICMPITYHNEKNKLLNKQNTYHRTNIHFKSSFVICALHSLSTSSMYLVGSLHIVPKKWQALSQLKKTWPFESWKWRTNASYTFHFKVDISFIKPLDRTKFMKIHNPFSNIDQIEATIFNIIVRFW
jgi:hypothetical protein